MYKQTKKGGEKRKTATNPKRGAKRTSTTYCTGIVFLVLLGESRECG